MSDVEKRQTQQRAISIAAVAAAFAVGGPLVGYRFDVQQIEETYRIDAAQLNAVYQKNRVAQAQTPAMAADARLTSGRDGWRTNVSYETAGARFQNSANPMAVLAGIQVATPADYSSGIGLLGHARTEQRELDCLAEAVYYEARSETVEGQRAVAEVVMNRVRHPSFPKTVCGVVYQGRLDATTGCQFTFTCDGALRHKPHGEAWDRAKEVAMHTWFGLSPPITGKATHYHTDYVDPYWSAGLIETKVIGSHIFYRMPRTRTEWTAAQASLAADRAAREAFVPGAEDGTLPASPALVAVSADGGSATPTADPAPVAAPASVVPVAAAVSVASLGL